MGLLDKLRSLFGSDQNRQSSSRDTDADVTVEHEPAAESEHAVKGTGGVGQETGDQQDQPPGGQPGEQQATDATEAGATPAAEPASAEEPTETEEPTEPAISKIEESETEPSVAEADTESSAEESETETSAEESETETSAEEADEEATPTEEAGTESPSVDEIKGIGPTYAERLEGAGIETVADLAAADPADVAEAAQTGENRAGDWVERAQDF